MASRWSHERRRKLYTKPLKVQASSRSLNLKRPGFLTALSERKRLLSCCHWMIGSDERVRVAVWGKLKVGAQIDFRLHTSVILCFKANTDSLLEVQIILFEVRSPTCSLRYINTDFQWADGHGIHYNGFYIIANNVISEVTCMHFKWSSPGSRKGLCNNRELRYIGSRPVLRFYILFRDQLKHTHTRTHTMVWVCLCVFQVGGGGGGLVGGGVGGLFMLSSARFAIKLDSLILGHLNSVHVLCIILVACFFFFVVVQVVSDHWPVYVFGNSECDK